MGTLDHAIVAVYLILLIGAGFVLSGRASRSTEDYFLAGRTRRGGRSAPRRWRATSTSPARWLWFGLTVPLARDAFAPDVQAEANET